MHTQNSYHPRYWPQVGWQSGCITEAGLMVNCCVEGVALKRDSCGQQCQLHCLPAACPRKGHSASSPNLCFLLWQGMVAHLSGVRGVLDQISETMYVRDIILSLAQRRHNNRFVG